MSETKKVIMYVDVSQTTPLKQQVEHMAAWVTPPASFGESFKRYKVVVEIPLPECERTEGAIVSEVIGEVSK